MIRENTNNTSSSSKESLLSRFKLKDRQLFIQIRHHFLNQRFLRDETILSQISTSLSRRLKSAFQSNQFKKFSILVIRSIESNLIKLNLFEKYNLQNLSVQRPFSLSSNIDRYRKLIDIFSFEKIKSTRHKKSIKMINIIILEF